MNELTWLRCSDFRELTQSIRTRISDRQARFIACACCRQIWGVLADERSRDAIELSELSADLGLGLGASPLLRSWQMADLAKRDSGLRLQAKSEALSDVLKSAIDDEWKAYVSRDPLIMTLDIASLIKVSTNVCQMAAARGFPLEDAMLDMLRNLDGGRQFASFVGGVLASKKYGPIITRMGELERDAFREFLAATAVSRLAWGIMSDDHSYEWIISVAGYSANSQGLGASVSQCNAVRDIVGNPFRRPMIDREWFRNKGARVISLVRGIVENRDFDTMTSVGELLSMLGYPDKEVIAHCLSRQEHYRGCWVLDGIAEASVNS